MDSQEKKTTYFMMAGLQNTKLLLKKIKAYVEKKKIETVIVATNTGETGAEVAKAFQGKNTIAVTRWYGFQQPENSS
jgi:hypothetical protein